MSVAYATYHCREGFGFGESHMTWQPGAPAGLAEPAEAKAPLEKCHPNEGGIMK